MYNNTNRWDTIPLRKGNDKSDCTISHHIKASSYANISIYRRTTSLYCQHISNIILSYTHILRLSLSLTRFATLLIVTPKINKNSSKDFVAKQDKKECGTSSQAYT